MCHDFSVGVRTHRILRMRIHPRGPPHACTLVHTQCSEQRSVTPLFSTMASRRLSQNLEKLLNPEEKGSDVVRAVVSKIESVFPTPSFAPGSSFLRLIAYVETKDGTKSSDGGIWNVTKKAFEGTKDTKTNTDIKAKHDEIKKRFGIDWGQVQWSEMKKPLYSGLAARLVLYNIPDAIPVELDGQAKYWKNRYSSATGAEQQFVDDVLAFVSGDLLEKFVD